MKYFSRLLVFVLFVSFFSACEKDPEEKGENLMVNEWIAEAMNIYYLWTDEMPSIAPDNTTDPEDYFYSLIYEEEDKWSFITDDFSGLMASFEGVSKTNGIAPSLVSFEGSDQVAIVVLYTYKNSPADNAGIKRGELITEIDGTVLNEDNYRELYEKESYNATISYIEMDSFGDNKLIEKGTVALESVVLDVDPVIFDTVYEEGAMKIGYMFISEFTFIDNFSTNVSTAFNRLGSDLDHLIVDLRYNGGGGLSSAQWLASSLAPQSAVENESLLVKLLYNDLLDEEFSANEKNYYFESTDYKYDFKNITFLANSNSASASELMIMGLDPYMEVDHIGENTYGKYTSSIPIYDLNEPVEHNYGILPIVAKYANANDFTDFKNGLEPDLEITEVLVDIRPLGSLEDRLIAAAYERITGIKPAVKKSQDINTQQYLPFKMMKNTGFEKRKDLIIN